MKRFFAVLALVPLLLAAVPAPANAQAPKNKGLFISPLRQYIDTAAGSTKNSSFTVANLTEKTITVDLSVKGFSVTDYAYDYRFNEPNADWVKLSVKQVSLKPLQSQKIAYQVAVPAGSASGGQYYTLFASSRMSQSGVDGTVQAATLLYVTVDGTLVRTSALVGSSVQRLAFGKQITYSLDVKNTGNIHYFAYFSGQLHGLTAQPATSGTSHLLLPGKIRRISGTIASPILPGVYKATYGYKTDSGKAVTESRLVVFMPPWAFAVVGLAALVALQLRNRKVKSRSAKPAEE